MRPSAAERPAQVVLDALAGVDARRQRVAEREHEVDRRERAERATPPTARPRPAAAAASRAFHRELALVEAQEHLAVQRRERVRDLVVDRPHHLLGRDAVGRERRDQRAGRRPDVDVELVDRPVARQQIQRPQRPDLVDAAGEPAAAQHERGARGAAPAPGRSVHLNDVAHDRSVWATRDGSGREPRELDSADFRAAGFRRLGTRMAPPRRPHHPVRRARRRPRACRRASPPRSASWRARWPAPAAPAAPT